MATKNAKWFNELSKKFGVNYQVIKGNDVTIHVAIIRGKKYTCLAQLNKAQVLDLFKGISQGVHSNTSDKIKATENTIYFNGNKHNIYDIVKGVEVKNLLHLMDNNRGTKTYYAIGDWLFNDSNRREYLKTIDGNWKEYLMLEYYLNTGKISNNLETLMTTWELLADTRSENEGVELLECDEDDDYSDLKYPVGV